MEKLGLIGIPGFVVKLRSFATALLHGIRNMPDDANAAEAWATEFPPRGFARPSKKEAYHASFLPPYMDLRL
jgi:hypothetical protein